MANASAQQNADWFGQQKQYWDSWFSQQRQFFGAAPDAAQNPYATLLQGWQDALSQGGTAPGGTDVFRQFFVRAGESYMNLLQQFSQGAAEAKPFEQLTQEWVENLKGFFTAAPQGSPFTQGFAGAFGGKDPLSALDPFNFIASFPGIGYTREKQEQLNHLYQQWSNYEARAREYTASMSKVGLEALQKFQEYVSNPPEGAAPLKSLKEVYGKWVDICEDIYAKYAMTEEYTRLYGEVVNALMAFKKKQNEVLDDLIGQANLPTRAEVDSLHKRLHELKREVAALKSAKPAAKAAAPKTAPKAAVKKPAAKKGKKK